MKLKKMIALLMAFVLCTALTACASETEDGVTVPTGMQAILSEAEDYYLIVPADWLTDTTVGLTSAYAEDLARSSVTVCANELTYEISTIEDYWASYAEQFAATFTNFTMLDDVPGDVTIGGEAGKKYRYTATVGDVDYQWMQVLFIHNGTLYMLTYTSTPDGYEDLLDDVSDIISAFTFR